MLRTTPLYDWHSANGAKMAEFAGWSMPIQYGKGSIEEHHLVRRSAGLFDVSHMGQVLVRGDGAAAWLDHMISSDIAKLELNHSTYGLLCNEAGGVLDDVFVYRLADEWLVVVNAANVEKDVSWFRDHLPASGVEIDDASEHYAMIAFQGPNAIRVMDGLVGPGASGAAGKTGDTGGQAAAPVSKGPATGGPVSAIERFAASALTINGTACIVGRTGYTGEDGVEIFAPSDRATGLWEFVLSGARAMDVECGPVGLAARDSLRFEPGFALYGHELTEEISPIQARLKWACNLDSEFIGFEAIRRQAEEGVPTKLATVRLTDRGVPRQGYEVLCDGRVVGTVASGMYAPTVDAYCANVYVESACAKTGTELAIRIRNTAKAAVVVKRPLYTPAYR